MIEEEFETADKNGKTIYKKYSTGSKYRTLIQYEYEELMDVQISFYESNSFLFAEIIHGKSPTIDKLEESQSDNHSILLETRTYFKNKSEGIRMTREIKVFENDDFNELENKLKGIKFRTEKIGEKEYRNLIERYRQTKSLKD
jgi:hypothetical protein